MARTVLTVQELDSLTGEAIAFTTVDAALVAAGAQVVNNTRCLIVLRTSGTGNVQVTIPSRADVFGRVGDVQQTVGLATLKAFGPFSPASIWGDGSNLLIDFATLAGLAGEVGIAVVVGQ